MILLGFTRVFQHEDKYLVGRLTSEASAVTTNWIPSRASCVLFYCFWFHTVLSDNLNYKGPRGPIVYQSFSYFPVLRFSSVCFDLLAPPFKKAPGVCVVTYLAYTFETLVKSQNAGFLIKKSALRIAWTGHNGDSEARDICAK